MARKDGSQINLGGMTAGPAAVGIPCSFIYAAGSQAHIVYRDTSGKLWDSWLFDRKTWNLQQLNLGGMTAGPAAAGDPSSFLYAGDSQSHVLYRDGAGTIWDCWYDSQHWNLQQLNMGGMTAGPAAAGDPSSFLYAGESQSHVLYRDGAGTIWDCWYDSQHWHLQQINLGGTTASPAAVGDPSPFIFGIADPVYHQVDILYCDAQGRIWDSRPPVPAVQSIEITFNTHGNERHRNTLLHVFVKNRTSTTSSSENDTNYISNYLAYQRYELADATDGAMSDVNPYLAYGEALSVDVGFEDPSTHMFPLQLRSKPVPNDEVVLPVVNIHILAQGDDTWTFDYTVKFTFIDGIAFSWSSNTDGVTGIILDQDNLDHSGIGIENPYNPQPLPSQYVANAVLTQVNLQFVTADNSDDDNKNADTRLNIHLVNRLSASASQDIAIASDVLHGTEFPRKSSYIVVFASSTLPLAPNMLPLASNSIRLEDVVLPVVNINIIPASSDKWNFNYRVTYYFSNGLSFSSTTSGIVLDQNFPKHIGVYRGDSFPTQTPPGLAKLTEIAVDPVCSPKHISLDFLGQKLAEFITDRQVYPLVKVRLHNTGFFGKGIAGAFFTTLPQGYYDVTSIDAAPPTPGTILPVGFDERVSWQSSPTVTKQQFALAHLADTWFDDINSQSLTANVDSSSATPISIALSFETGGPKDIGGGFLGNADLSEFSITLHLTLTFDRPHNKIDLMSWIDDIAGLKFTPSVVYQDYIHVQGTFLGQVISEEIGGATTGTTDPEGDFIGKLKDQVLLVELQAGNFDAGGTIRQKLRDTIYDSLSNQDGFYDSTVRDHINNFANSWFLGGVVEGSNPCKVECPSPTPCRPVVIENNELLVSYAGPAYNFIFPDSLGWPMAQLDPGPLANIDHIVVLTMENRSFDHMLGYLSLPVEKGGRGRTDVDGLKGNESNPFNGQQVASFPLKAGDTVFSPDPPHGYEPVRSAINGGKMDGFVASYAAEHGPTLGPRIMGYHTAENVPVYDTLSFDAAICNRWFASHPGPTFCNRFYELSGRLNIDPVTTDPSQGRWEFSNSSTKRPVFTKTIFDYLSESNVSWKYFEHGYCFLRFFQKYTFDTDHISTFTDPVNSFVNLAQSGNLPSVTFIDPHFIELPPDGNCDGPPADIRLGQQLVQQVVEAVVTSPAWANTLLIVTYDEHGGFYDHVPPPAATKVSPESLDTYGVRVPAFVLSPWIGGGTVFGHDGFLDSPGGGGGFAANNDVRLDPGHNLHFDHTSIMKTIARCFLHAKPPYLGPRYAAANDLSSVLGTVPRNNQFLPFIPYTLTYAASNMRLDVPGGTAAPGAALWQYEANGTPAQDLNFEDADGGYFHVRTHPGNLYVTVDVPAGVDPGTIRALAIKQDIKYSATTGTQSVEYQKWKFTPGTDSPGLAAFTVQNAAFATRVLHPAEQSADSGTPVVLEDLGQSGVLPAQTVWLISSALIRPTNMVTVSPAFLNFATTGVGLTSTEQKTVTVTVPPGIQFAINSIALLSLSGAADNNFFCVPPPGSPPPAGSINLQNGKLAITVFFRPTAGGTCNANLVITHTAGGSPLRVALSGIGDATPIPLLACSPGSLYFNPKSAVQTITLENTGNAPLNINSISVEGGNFSIRNTCVSPTGMGTLQPNQTCTVTATCAFSGPGGTSSLVIVHNAFGSPTTVDLNASSKGGVDP